MKSERLPLNRHRHRHHHCHRHRCRHPRYQYQNPYYRAVVPQYYHRRHCRHYHRPQLLRPRAQVGDIIYPYSLLDVLLLTADFVVLVAVCFACRFLISRLLLLLILLFSTS